MSKKLLEQINRGTNPVKVLFDIPTGKYMGTNPEDKFPDITSLNLPACNYLPTRHGVSFMTYTLLEDAITKTKGGTIERYLVAVALFKYMGFMVEWDGTLNQPTVSWMDTEGWSSGLDLPELIRRKLMDDVEVKPDHELLGEHFHKRLNELKDESKNRIDLTIDSFSTLD